MVLLGLHGQGSNLVAANDTRTYHLMLCAPCLQALQHLSESHKFLETLRSWLAELLPERSDANLHVTHKIMELMAKLTSSWAAISAVSGLMDTVRAASEHRNREVAQMGTALRKVCELWIVNKICAVTRIIFGQCELYTVHAVSLGCHLQYQVCSCMS